MKYYLIDLLKFNGFLASGVFWMFVIYKMITAGM